MIENTGFDEYNNGVKICKGKAYIYVYAQNGVCKTIKVIVK